MDKTIATTAESTRIINLAAGATATCIERNTTNELGLVSTIVLGLRQVCAMNLAPKIDKRVEGVAGDGNSYLANVVARCFAERWSITEKPNLLSSFEDMKLLFGQARETIEAAEESRACAERLKAAMAVLEEIGFGGDAETQAAPTKAVVVGSTTPPAQPAAAPIAAATPKPGTAMTEAALSSYKQRLEHLVANTIKRNLKSLTEGGNGMFNPWATEAACRWGMELIHDRGKRLRTRPFTTDEAAELETVLINFLKPVMDDREIDAFFDRKDAELGLPQRKHRHSVVAGITLDPSSPKLTQEQIQAKLSGRGAGQQVAPPQIRSQKQQRKDAAEARRLSTASDKPSKKALKRDKKATAKAAAEATVTVPTDSSHELDDAALDAATAPQAEPGFDVPLYQLLGPATPQRLQNGAQNAA